MFLDFLPAAEVAQLLFSFVCLFSCNDFSQKTSFWGYVREETFREVGNCVAL